MYARPAKTIRGNWRVSMTTTDLSAAHPRLFVKVYGMHGFDTTALKDEAYVFPFKEDADHVAQLVKRTTKQVGEDWNVKVVADQDVRANPRYNDCERAEWVRNDEGLYNAFNHWKSNNTGGMRTFVRNHRGWIDDAIRKVTSGAKQSHFLAYDKDVECNPGYDGDKLKAGGFYELHDMSSWGSDTYFATVEVEKIAKDEGFTEPDGEFIPGEGFVGTVKVVNADDTSLVGETERVDVSDTGVVRAFGMKLEARKLAGKALLKRGLLDNPDRPRRRQVRKSLETRFIVYVLASNSKLPPLYLAPYGLTEAKDDAKDFDSRDIAENAIREYVDQNPRALNFDFRIVSNNLSKIARRPRQDRKKAKYTVTRHHKARKPVENRFIVRISTDDLDFPVSYISNHGLTPTKDHAKGFSSRDAAEDAIQDRVDRDPDAVNFLYEIIPDGSFGYRVKTALR